MATKDEARAAKEKLIARLCDAEYTNGFGLSKDKDDDTSWVVAIGLKRAAPVGAIPKIMDGVKVVTTFTGRIRAQ